MMRRLAFVLVLVLPLGACSSDDESATADPEAFCELLAGQSRLEPTSAEGQAYMEDLERSAPDEVADNVNTMLEMFRAFAAIPDDDPEGGPKAAALIADPGVLAAVDEIDAYAVRECGLAPGTISGETGVQGPALTTTVP